MSAGSPKSRASIQSFYQELCWNSFQDSPQQLGQVINTLSAGRSIHLPQSTETVTCAHITGHMLIPQCQQHHSVNRPREPGDESEQVQALFPRFVSVPGHKRAPDDIENKRFRSRYEVTG